MNTIAAIQAAIHQHLEVSQKMLEVNVEVLRQIADSLSSCLKRGGKIYLCGNGGSAADAQHVAGELVGRFLRERHPLPVIALTTDTSILTSIGNDYGFDQVFARQVQAMASPGDVVVGLSTSGNSTNILAAMQTARASGALTVGFTGASGGKLKDVVDVCLCVPSDHTPRIQEAHILAWHIICELVEQSICDEQ